MDEKPLLHAIFETAEFINEAELTNTSKHLLMNYYDESVGLPAVDRARQAVIRYTQCGSLPTLEEMRKKTPAELSRLEHLVLKLEFEAKKVDDAS